MALAAGTILYVVFFEIVPRAKEVGATGIEQVAAMTAGFAVFLPTMLIREWKLLISRVVKNLVQMNFVHEVHLFFANLN